MSSGGAGFNIAGVRELQAALDRMITTAESAAVVIVNRSEAHLEDAIKQQFTGAHARGKPTTSAPGQPPDVVTGTLRRSITGDPARPSGGGAVGRVYPSAVYARIQELGGTTGRGGTLPARPFVRPAYDVSQSKLTEIAAEEWRKVT